MEPEKAGQTLKKSARIGLTGTLIGIYTIADATTVGLLIVIVSAWTHAPLILFAVAAVLLTIVNLGCCRWIQRRWDEWIGSGIARRIEARLEKMRRGILKHPVAWIERGSDGWFTLAAALINAIIVVTTARVISGEPVSGRRVFLASAGYSVFFAALFTIIGIGLRDVIRAL